MDEHGSARSDAAVLSAMMDWWLLGEGAEAVISDHSSFGYSAVARSRFAASLPVTVANDLPACHRRVSVPRPPPCHVPHTSCATCHREVRNAAGCAPP